MIEWNGTRLSKLCLGTVQFGIEYGVANQNGKPAQQQVDEILAYVQSAGVNCFDTAQLYGESERVLGNYLGSSSLELPMIISKVPSDTFNSDEKSFTGNIKQSLDRLRIQKLYGLLMHDAEQLKQWSSADAQRVVRLKEEGLIEHFGVSIYTDDEFHAAIKNPEIELIQIPYNLFDQRGLNKGWFELAKKHNKLIFIRSVYLQGLLLMEHEAVPHYLETAKPHIQKLEQICEKLQITRNELCLSFVNTTAPDSPLLFGCETLAQAEENIDTFNHTKALRTDELTEIIDAFKAIDDTIYNPAKWNRS